MLCLRHARPDDLEAVVELEASGFPPEEGADRQRLMERLATFPENYWLLFDETRLVAYSGGLASDIPDLEDCMYADAGMHRADGAWQMIFSLCTDVEHRGQGLASHVLQGLIDETRARGKKGVVLTCKKKLVPFYLRFGFADEGVCPSTHGGQVWHQMRLTF